MKTNDLLNKIIKNLELGSLIEPISQVSGGLTHRMFKIFTTEGKYIVKLLNPNIMSRSTALANFNKADDEVKEMIEHIVYYDKMEHGILDNISKI